ncbi:MAG TPA: hypothetical protein DGN59_16870, partial [Candidatus Latescibacteria bacterium]|nr:hypothetical protein [Candidatus Latescibacterota bacterium]
IAVATGKHQDSGTLERVDLHVHHGGIIDGTQNVQLGPTTSVVFAVGRSLKAQQQLVRITRFRGGVHRFVFAAEGRVQAI